MIENIPVTIDPISGKDLLLGFFVALALKRGRITAILDRILPTEKKDG
jgi:hypothetical protein